MEHVGQFIVISAAIIVVIVAIIYPKRRRKKRREEMAALANQIGWSFDVEPDVSHENDHSQFEMFTRGFMSAAHNTLTGTIGLDGRMFAVRMGDFTYWVSSRSGRSNLVASNEFSYMLVDLPFTELPNLAIRPEGIGDRLAEVVGYDDVNFESAEFSKKFWVKGTDKRFAYDVIHPRMMEFLLRGTPPGLELAGSELCVSDGRSTWGPAVFTSLLPWVREFISLLPAHLSERLKDERRKP